MAKKQEILDKRFELYERAHTKEYYAVAKWLSEVKFQSTVFGADQADVWRKLEKLCELYEAALDAERARNAKLERKLRSVTAAKRSDTPAKADTPSEQGSNPPVNERSLKAEPVKKTPVEQVPVKTEPVKEVQTEAPAKKPASAEEDILQDLLREFGAAGGKPNG